MDAVLSLEEVELRMKKIIVDRRSFDRITDEVRMKEYRIGLRSHPTATILQLVTPWGSVVIEGDER
jgi:hypothetical protein